MVRYKLHLHR